MLFFMRPMSSESATGLRNVKQLAITRAFVWMTVTSTRLNELAIVPDELWAFWKYETEDGERNRSSLC